MFENGNFKRRKRNKRPHPYKNAGMLYKSHWSSISAADHLLYGRHPHNPYNINPYSVPR